MTPQDPPTATQPPPPPPPPTEPPRRLTRSSSGAMLGGVAAGLARHLGLDPALVRVVFVLLALFGGAGAALYLVLWLVLPAEDGRHAFGADRSATGKAVLVAVLAVAVIALPFGGPGIVFAGPAMLVLVVVAAAGFLVWRAVGGEGSPSMTRAALLVLAVVGAVVLGAGAALAAAFGAGTVVAVVVLATGIALVVGGFLGGARWLVVPALAMAIPLAAVAAADVDLTGGVGERELRPVSVAELDDRYRLGVGELELDLRDVRLPAGTTDLRVDVEVGEIRVLVPRDACVHLDARVDVGKIDAFGRVSDGFDIRRSTAPVARSDAPVLRIDAAVGLGHIEIDHDGLLGGQPACRA